MRGAIALILLIAVISLCLSPRASYATHKSDAPEVVRGEDIVREAQTWINTPYQIDGRFHGGGIDCADLSYYTYGHFGVELGEGPQDQMQQGEWRFGEIQPGDLIFFSEDGSGVATHVGIAKDAATLIHASAYAGYVTEAPIADIPGYVGAVAWESLFEQEGEL